MKIHFIGIGGIGASFMAQYFLKTGYKVSGSDLHSSEITDALKKMGAKIMIGEQKATNIPMKTDLVLISPAIGKDNPEFKEALKRKIEIKSWKAALGDLTKKYDTIAIAGAHGKSTTTSMMSVVLMRNKLDPTVMVGTKLKEFGGSNFRFGRGKNLVIELDEYKNSLLDYGVKMVILTNLEYEHPDYFKNLNHYLKVFKDYLKHVAKNGGTLILNRDDKKVLNMAKDIKAEKHFYSVKQKEAKILKKILKIPGEHNVSNALAVLTVARLLKIPDKKIFEALSRYHGAWRRFEIIPAKMNNKRITIVSDYGHHPTQVKSTIEAAREKYPKRKIWIIYQPHQYLRTHYFFNDYVKAFDKADEIVLPEIYAVAGRENIEIMKKLSSSNLVEAIQKRFKKINKKSNVHFLKDYSEIPEFLKFRVKNNDVVIVMGAGSIYNVLAKIKK